MSKAGLRKPYSSNNFDSDKAVRMNDDHVLLCATILHSRGMKIIDNSQKEDHIGNCVDLAYNHLRLYIAELSCICCNSQCGGRHKEHADSSDCYVSAFKSIRVD